MRTLNIQTAKTSYFRNDVGEIADCLSFQREFLKRELGDKQKEAYLAVWGDKAGEWNKLYHEIVLLIGMKGGKNFWAEGDVAYLCYYINCLKNAHEYFSKITGTLIPYTSEKTFDVVNVSSVDETQARHAFFETVKNVLRQTKDPATGDNWFERYAGLDLREQFGDFKKKEIIFPTKEEGRGGIRLLCFNSAATAPEGMHMLRFYADELSRADTKQKYLNADQLYELGLSNTRASFPNRVGKIIGWSYPNDSDWDLTNDRFEKAITVEGIYAVKLKTWEFNPARSKEMFKDAYTADPIKAARFYECKKPISRDNFYQPYVETIAEAINPEVTNRIAYKIINRTAKVNTGEIKQYTSLEILGIKGDKRVRCFAHDAGSYKDRYVIIGGYNETIDAKKLDIFINEDPEVIATNKKPIVDFMIVLDPKEGYPIDYLAVGDIWTAIIRAFPNTQSINSDHWQTEKLIQEIIAQGISSKSYFFSRQKQLRLYTIQRAQVWSGNISVCDDRNEAHRVQMGSRWFSPSELWKMEAEKLIKDGTKLDHPPDFSKDVQDATAILLHDLMMLESQATTRIQYGRFDDLNDEALRDLCTRFMNMKYELLKQDTEKEKINRIIAEQMNLDIDFITKLARWVKDDYNY